MPRAAIDRGFAMRVAPLHLIAGTLQSICVCGSFSSSEQEAAPVLPAAGG
jgi:hypothetical protein